MRTIKTLSAVAAAATLCATLGLCACTQAAPANTTTNTTPAMNVTDKPANNAATNAAADKAPQSPVEGYVFDRHDSKGDHFVNPATGKGLYVTPEGTLEVVDDDGTILVDTDIDGRYDQASHDGGASWTDISAENRTWK